MDAKKENFFPRALCGLIDGAENCIQGGCNDVATGTCTADSLRVDIHLNIGDGIRVGAVTECMLVILNQYHWLAGVALKRINEGFELMKRGESIRSVVLY